MIKIKLIIPNSGKKLIFIVSNNMDIWFHIKLRMNYTQLKTYNQSNNNIDMDDNYFVSNKFSNKIFEATNIFVKIICDNLFDSISFIGITMFKNNYSSNYFKDSKFINVVFDELESYDDKFKNCNFDQCRFNKCKFNEVKFEDINFNDVNFSNCDLTNVDFSIGCTFTNCIFELSKMSQVKFNDAIFINVSICLSNFKKCDFGRSLFINSKFIENEVSLTKFNDVCWKHDDDDDYDDDDYDDDYIFTEETLQYFNSCSELKISNLSDLLVINDTKIQPAKDIIEETSIEKKVT